MKYDVVIIGSGLGGLLCGNILSREGYKVCVLEKNPKSGGCLQIFARNKCIFNTGLNYTEGLATGQILNKYFRFFGILDQLKLKQMDENGFEVITYNNKEYRFAQGEDNFIETLAQDFPEERQTLIRYMEKLNSICDSFPLYNLSISDTSGIDYESVFGESLGDFLQNITSNVTLQNVLAGNNLLYGGVYDRTPLYLHALITRSFISSAWRITDGSQKIATLLINNIKQNGGAVFTNSEVKKLKTENKKISAVLLSDGRQVQADVFISAIHPANTLAMLDENATGPFYRSRIMNLENTKGMFTVYLVLKENTFPYLNHNHYYYKGDSVWTSVNGSETSWPESCFMYTPATSRSEKYADGLIAMTYMDYKLLKKWENTSVGKRGADYEAFKNEKAEKLIGLVAEKFPDIRSQIKACYTSTPLTYRDYTGTPQGSAYGILKDFQMPLKTLVMPKTKIPNLLFTGQNLNVHGILGVSIGAVMTCGEILGLEYLLKKIRSC